VLKVRLPVLKPPAPPPPPIFDEAEPPPAKTKYSTLSAKVDPLRFPALDTISKVLDPVVVKV
jgi:hypothetical protein